MSNRKRMVFDHGKQRIVFTDSELVQEEAAQQTEKNSLVTRLQDLPWADKVILSLFPLSIFLFILDEPVLNIIAGLMHIFALAMVLIRRTVTMVFMRRTDSLNRIFSKEEEKAAVDYYDFYKWFTTYSRLPETNHRGPVLETMLKEEPELFSRGLALYKIQKDLNVGSLSKEAETELNNIKIELRHKLEGCKKVYFNRLYATEAENIRKMNEPTPPTTLGEEYRPKALEQLKVEDTPLSDNWDWVTDLSRSDAQHTLDQLTKTINQENLDEKFKSTDRDILKDEIALVLQDYHNYNKTLED